MKDRFVRFAAAVMTVFFVSAVPVDTAAADLRVTITGVRSDGGTVRMNLYDHSDAFPKSKTAVMGGKAPAKKGTVEIRFTGLKPGRYAAALYHDENDNGKFDQGIFGIPLEGYAFSNNAKAFLSAPSFEDAAFDLPAADGAIEIRMGY
ncbi:MAG: DUF2141 domain-containing protein [Rhodospirillales bacterium]